MLSQMMVNITKDRSGQLQARDILFATTLVERIERESLQNKQVHAGIQYSL